MKALRYLAIGLLLALIAGGLTVSSALRHQTQIVRLVLAQLEQRTGFNIVITGARLGFRNHLIVVLEHPRVMMGEREIARLADIRAVLSYGSLIHLRGLPLYELMLDRAELRMPMNTTAAALGPSTRLDVDMIARLEAHFGTLAGLTRRIELIDAAITDQNTLPLIDHLHLVAYLEHRRPGRWPWLVSFDASWTYAPIKGLRLAGDLWYGYNRRKPEIVSAGRLWFWGVDLNRLSPGGPAKSGQVQGTLRLTLKRSAQLNGNLEVEFRNLVIGGERLTREMALGNYSLEAAYQASPERLDFTTFSLRDQSSRLIAGNLSIAQPYDSARTITLSAGGMKLELPQAAAWLRYIRGVPTALADFAKGFTAGRLTLAEAALERPIRLDKLTAATLRQVLKVEAILAGVGYLPPATLEIQPIRELGAQLFYSGGILQLTQGSAQIGHSSVSALSVRADLRRAPAEISYGVKLAGALDASDANTAAGDALYKLKPELKGQLEWIRGTAPLVLSANGRLREQSWSLPSAYTAAVELKAVEFKLKKAPGAIALKSGQITFVPGQINVNHVLAVPATKPPCSIIFNGSVTGLPRATSVRDFTVELHNIPTAQWLPLFVDTAAFSADGPVGGRIVINSDAAKGGAPITTGKLTLGRGEIQLGFLRSAMITQSATLSLNGKGLVLDIPAARLEGEPVDFKLTVPELAKPTIRIDARANKLNLEVMRFIRLPWSKSKPPNFFPAPVSGHIDASEAIFFKLAMTNVSSDFSHDATDWHVSNFSAKSLGGRMELNIAGQAGPNNWINVKGTIAGMEAAPLFLIADQSKRSPLLGKIYANADVWANTDVNFFDTLAGTAAVAVKDGTLDRFTLLTRILSLIDLKNWLTAQVPDPRISGIPFDTLTADFKGHDGDFYTDNLLMNGPVIDMTASGDIHVGDGTINMEIGMMPFNTANWIVKQIPLVGENLAGGSNGLVAAYFRVSGPIKDPTVRPMPITSVKQFIIRMLSLPINIIKPNTIR